MIDDLDIYGMSAEVVVVNGRFFKRFLQTGAMQTSWDLPGARLFCIGYDRHEREKIEKRLREKGHKIETAIVKVVPPGYRIAQS